MSVTSSPALIAAVSVLVLALGSPDSTAQRPNHLARVQQLGLETLPGPVPTYFSPGARERATALQKMVAEALAYSNERLSIKPELTLAVLNEPHWASVRAIPYGVPWVSFAPYVAVLPSDLSRSVIVQGFPTMRDRASVETRQLLTAAGVPFESVPHQLNDFIAYHEVGHVSIEAYRLNQSQRWFDEMLATFIGYAFMRERHAGQARAWDALMRFNAETSQPAFRSLEEFERRYSDMPPETYGWFQAMFHRRLVEVYEARGVKFLEDVRAAGIGSGKKVERVADLIAALDRIVPGFHRWAEFVESAK